MTLSNSILLSKKAIRSSSVEIVATTKANEIVKLSPSAIEVIEEFDE